MMKEQRIPYKMRSADLYIALGILSILVGGTLSAAFAHEPSRLVMWASAYLVLAAGLMQIAFGLLLRHLALNDMERNLYAAVALYNIGGLGVIAGTALKSSLTGPTVLVLGEAIFLLAIVIIAYSIRGLKRSTPLLTLYLLLAVIFVSTLVGLFLSTIIQLG